MVHDPRSFHHHKWAKGLHPPRALCLIWTMWVLTYQCNIFESEWLPPKWVLWWCCFVLSKHSAHLDLSTLKCWSSGLTHCEFSAIDDDCAMVSSVFVIWHDMSSITRGFTLWDFNSVTRLCFPVCSPTRGNWMTQKSALFHWNSNSSTTVDRLIERSRVDHSTQRFLGDREHVPGLLRRRRYRPNNTNSHPFAFGWWMGVWFTRRFVLRLQTGLFHW